ncbi:uncharacterized protein LOC112512833 [Cynara cardunculus var. scolymus]|uniref:uncharacterized protein LOC112512833 n=1 Tax=Cynara cardunculus var. scolymus TaxID=59895 RepID=UPI000D62610C|nr:uncharacterized protein LOC112512833 [Cynara cardunculus var. scolymus]
MTFVTKTDSAIDELTSSVGMLSSTVSNVKSTTSEYCFNLDIGKMPWNKCPHMKLGPGEVQPVSVNLQLDDSSMKYPYAVIEDTLIKVNKFYYLFDFVVMDMDKDKEIPLIHGRPFLATRGALVDVKEVNLTLIVGNKDVVFNVSRAATHRLE